MNGALNDTWTQLLNSKRMGIIYMILIVTDGINYLLLLLLLLASLLIKWTILSTSCTSKQLSFLRLVLDQMVVCGIWSVETAWRDCWGSPAVASIKLWTDPFLKPLGPVPQDLTLPGGVRFIAWYLRHPFLEWVLTGPEAFLCLTDLSELWSCASTH